MSAGYIFKPPPPPPPTQSAPSSAFQHPRGRGRGNSFDGSSRGGRGDRAGGGFQGRGGGNHGRGRGRGGHRGRGGNYNNSNHHGGNKYGQNHPAQQRPPPEQQQQQQFQQLPTFPQNTHVNPAFLLQAAALPTQLPTNPLFSPWLQAASPTTLQQPVQQSSYLSYTQELSQASQQSLKSYSDLSTPSNAPSYSHPVLPHLDAHPPPPPPTKSRPDMSEEEWLAMNGGKLLGTNIAPPKTTEEIAEWIAERKRRFPSKDNVAKKLAEEEARRKEFATQREEARRKRALEEEERKAEVEAKKQKLDAGGEDSDSAPETFSARIPVAEQKSTTPRNNTQEWKKKKKEKSNNKHQQRKLKAGGKKEEPKAERKSLYAQLVDKEIERENKIVIAVLKYLKENNMLKE